jgi:hypothetical protein
LRRTKGKKEREKDEDNKETNHANQKTIASKDVVENNWQHWRDFENNHQQKVTREISGRETQKTRNLKK